MNLYKEFAKRWLDLFGAACGLIVLSPLLVLITLLVWRDVGRPLFIQERVGLHGKVFRLIKFRTMRDQRDRSGALLSDGERLTSLGRRLRSSSLDELPELWNVINGEMSLVGPRPLLVEYLPLYSRFEGRRHEVRPGITGWAQVNGRNGLAWSDKFALDVFYVDNCNLLMDIRILFKTVKEVISKRGISGHGEDTMSKFTGTDL